MSAHIILVEGGTGVGTSRIAMFLAHELNIMTIQSTDFLREGVRSIFTPGLFPSFEKSTYIAGKTENYDEKDLSVKKSEIIRGFKNQCSIIDKSLQGIIRRAMLENQPLIVEGAHLRPGFIYDALLEEFPELDLKEVVVGISDEGVHKKRFIYRQEQSPGRLMDKYLSNFTEIRWIHDYIMDRAKRYQHIVSVDNSGDFELTKKQVLNCI